MAFLMQTCIQTQLILVILSMVQGLAQHQQCYPSCLYMYIMDSMGTYTRTISQWTTCCKVVSCPDPPTKKNWEKVWSKGSHFLQCNFPRVGNYKCTQALAGRLPLLSCNGVTDRWSITDLGLVFPIMLSRERKVTPLSARALVINNPLTSCDNNSAIWLACTISAVWHKEVWPF